MKTLLFTLCLAAVASRVGAQAATAPRFKDPDGITADPTGLRRDPTVKIPHARYPRDLAANGVTGAPVAAFVIDTTGRVEMETVSFLNAPHAEFAKAVCDFVQGFRFLPFKVADQKWRVLLVESFAFNTWPEADTTAFKFAARTQEDFATKPIARVVAQLEPLPHCDPARTK